MDQEQMFRSGNVEEIDRVLNTNLRLLAAAFFDGANRAHKENYATHLIDALNRTRNRGFEIELTVKEEKEKTVTKISSIQKLEIDFDNVCLNVVSGDKKVKYDLTKIESINCAV